MLDLKVLADIGLNQYERQTLLALLKLGVTDATTLCREGEVPTSKIYSATERLESLGLILIQRSRPRQFAIFSPDELVNRLSQIARQQAEAFSEKCQELLEIGQESGAKAFGAFTDVALGPKQQVIRHIIHLASAKRSIRSYVEGADIEAIECAHKSGYPILRNIARNCTTQGAEMRILFGGTKVEQDAFRQFAVKFSKDLACAALRVTAPQGYPFHVVDERLVILSLENPLWEERRYASLMSRTEQLGTRMSDGFDQMWDAAASAENHVDK